MPGPAWGSHSVDDTPAGGFVSNEGRHDCRRSRATRAFRDEPATCMGGNVAPVDRANAETINFRKTRFWTGMAASNRPTMGIQEVRRVSIQAVISIGSSGSADEDALKPPRGLARDRRVEHVTWCLRNTRPAGLAQQRGGLENSRRSGPASDGSITRLRQPGGNQTADVVDRSALSLSSGGRCIRHLRSERGMKPCDAGCHCKNEWAPVHESIAGPDIFVIGEGFLVETSMASGSDSAWPLRSAPAYMLEFSKGAMRLAAAYDLDRTWTLR
jgi:hypothetical protein